MWFDMVPQRSVVKKCTRPVVIRTSGSEKGHLTVVLAVMADGSVLPPPPPPPPMIIFKGKTDRTIKDLVIPAGCTSKVQVLNVCLCKSAIPSSGW